MTGLGGLLRAWSLELIVLMVLLTEDQWRAQVDFVLSIEEPTGRTVALCERGIRPVLELSGSNCVLVRLG